MTSKITPVTAAGGNVVHIGRRIGQYPSGAPRYAKACGGNGNARYEPHALAPGTPITCKRCLAKLPPEPSLKEQRLELATKLAGGGYAPSAVSAEVDRQLPLPAQERAAARQELEERRLELELSMLERRSMGLPPIGPLTQSEAAHEEAYTAYCRESEREEEARVRAGGRTICPACGQRSLKSRTVATLGGGLPNSEYSELYTCERAACGYEAL